MGNRAYYNEIDAYAAEWLRNLIKAGHIPDGDVDERSIADVQPMDIADYTQCHFFAGIAGWSHALRLAGWPDDQAIWTGSCPCQPFSVAGKGAGTDDPRHLWPHFFRLIRACRPPVVMGEQVAGKAGYGWLDGVRTDLEGEGYACEGVDIPACAVNAPHIRQRLYWVAHAGDVRAGRIAGQASDSGRGAVDPGAEGLRCADGARGAGWADARNIGNMVNPDRAGQLEQCGAVPISQEQPGAERAGSGRSSGGQGLGRDSGCGDMAHPDSGRCRGRQEEPERGEERRVAAERAGPWDDMADTDSELHDGSGNIGAGWRAEHPNGGLSSFWDDAEWLTGADGKTRRVKSGVRLLAHGVPGRVGRLRAYGNAIVPPLAAEVIKAFMNA